MDIFFKESTEHFFNQFRIASDDNYGPDEVINDNDENIYDAIQEKASHQVRWPSIVIDKNDSDEFFPDISDIIESLQCPFCLEVAAQPVFIKYCLHFFCRSCIEQQIRNYKKECPLCKKSMGTKRELRSNPHIENFVKEFRPLIDQYEDEQAMLNKEIQKHQMQEQIEMAKLKGNQQLLMQAEALGFNTKKRIVPSVQIEDELNEEEKLLIQQDEIEINDNDSEQFNLDSQLESRTLEEFEEQRRIQRKVDRINRIKAFSNQNEVILNKLIQVSQNQKQILSANSDIKTLMLSPEEARYYSAYERLRKQLSEQQEANQSLQRFKLYDKNPKLDLKIKLLFDEDLRTMIFPRVKEFTFKASSDSTLEIAAKALACKNEHPNLWSKYSFSVIKKYRDDDGDTVEQQEIEITDLRKSFGMLKDNLDQDEVILFYKINTKFQSPFQVNQTQEPIDNQNQMQE